MTDRAFIDQLAETWGRTAEVCAGLTTEQWDLPTDCPGWTVRDQLSHLVGTEAMLLGEQAPPPAPPGLPHVINPLGEMNEGWVDARRSTPGPEVLAEFEKVTGERLGRLRAMTDEELAVEGPSPIGKVPYATFMDVRVMDCWVHEQDIRRAVGRPGGLDGGAADASIRRFTGSVPFVVGKRVTPPDGTTVVVEITGPLARTVAVEMRGGRAERSDPSADPTVRLTMDAETFACLVAGRWDASRASVAIEGDTELGRAVVANLKTIP